MEHEDSVSTKEDSTTTKHEAQPTIAQSTQEQLLKICFSALKSWPLYVFFLVLYFLPFRYELSIHRFLNSESPLVHALYSENFLMAFILFFVVTLLYPQSWLWLGLTAILIASGSLHILLALGAVAGVFFALARRQLKQAMTLSSGAEKSIGAEKSLQLWVSGLKMLAVFLATAVSFYLYHFLRQQGYYSSSITINRFETFVLSVFLNHLIQTVLLAIWGHFYVRR